jgi:hypothetical protein
MIIIDDQRFALIKWKNGGKMSIEPMCQLVELVNKENDYIENVEYTIYYPAPSEAKPNPLQKKYKVTILAKGNFGAV